jgi:phosphatidylethanolamine/phosphatidyl-N-methylethanolamine N-methyltransferase
MSFLFFKRVLANPMRVGYLVPSSPFLTRETSSRLDFSRPRVVVELGPGEGCHTRQILRRMGPDCHLILFELDPEFVAHLNRQFRNEPRITVLQSDALHIREALHDLGYTQCDYVVSGIPFSTIEKPDRDRILNRIAGAMTDEGRFIAYQLTTRLCDEDHLFELAEKSFCALNFPPVNVMEFRRVRTAGNCKRPAVMEIPSGSFSQAGA